MTNLVGGGSGVVVSEYVWSVHLHSRGRGVEGEEEVGRGGEGRGGGKYCKSGHFCCHKMWQRLLQTLRPQNVVH